MRTNALARGALVVALAAACRHPSESDVPTPVYASHGQRDEITKKEIQTVLSQASSAYDIVKVLRPTMLLRRAVTGVEPTPVLMANELPGVHVHVDDSHVGPIDLLSTIPADVVTSIHWLSASEASTKYGNGHTAGVIAVVTQTGRW